MTGSNRAVREGFAQNDRFRCRAAVSKRSVRERVAQTTGSEGAVHERVASLAVREHSLPIDANCSKRAARSAQLEARVLPAPFAHNDAPLVHLWLGRPFSAMSDERQALSGLPFVAALNDFAEPLCSNMCVCDPFFAYSFFASATRSRAPSSPRLPSVPRL